MGGAVAAAVAVIEVREDGEPAAEWIERLEVVGERGGQPLLRREEGVVDHAKRVGDADEPLRRGGGLRPGKRLEPRQGDAGTGAFEKHAAGMPRVGSGHQMLLG